MCIILFLVILHASDRVDFTDINVMPERNSSFVIFTDLMSILQLSYYRSQFVFQSLLRSLCVQAFTLYERHNYTCIYYYIPELHGVGMYPAGTHLSLRRTTMSLKATPPFCMMWISCNRPTDTHEDGSCAVIVPFGSSVKQKALVLNRLNNYSIHTNL